MNDKKYFVTVRDLKSAMAYCAIRQSPEVFPRNLEVVLEKIQNHCEDKFVHECFDFIFYNFTSNELREFIEQMINDIPEIKDWNLSMMEKKMGITDIEDPSRNKRVCVFVHGDLQLDQDFIDLHALSRNVTNLILAKAEDEI